MNHDEYLSNGDKCLTNVECPTTCCKERQCVSIEKCKDDVILIYIIVGVLAGSFFVVVLIIYTYLLVESKRNVANIRIENQQKAQKKAEAFKSSVDPLRNKHIKAKVN